MDNEVDRALARLRRERHIAVILPFWGVANDLIAGTDLVLTVARRNLDRVRDDARLRVFEPPFPIDSFEFAQLARAPARRRAHLAAADDRARRERRVAARCGRQDARAIYSAPRSPYPAGCRGRRACATCAARTASTTIRNGHLPMTIKIDRAALARGMRDADGRAGRRMREHHRAAECPTGCRQQRFVIHVQPTQADGLVTAGKGVNGATCCTIPRRSSRCRTRAMRSRCTRARPRQPGTRSRRIDRRTRAHGLHAFLGADRCGAHGARPHDRRRRRGASGAGPAAGRQAHSVRDVQDQRLQRPVRRCDRRNGRG